MASLSEIRNVIKKIVSVNGLATHVCFFGGSIPYIYYGKESGRDHSDIDVLVDEEYMDYVRSILKDAGIYKEKRDSACFGLDDDYGLKVFIDGVYVEFEPMSLKDGIFTRKSFSPDKEVAGAEHIPYVEPDDFIIELDIDGIKTYCQSMELIKVGKEKYRRDKDIDDIRFIEANGFDAEKYERVRKLVGLTEGHISSYEELRNKKNNL